MGARSFVRIATAEALLVLALGIAVLVRGGEAPPPTTIGDSLPREPRTGHEHVQVDPATAPAAARTEPVASREPRERAGPIESVTAGDPVGLVLYGAVQDQDGNPLSSWAISLTPADPDSTLRLRTIGERFPCWSLSGFPPGSYRLRCQAHGWQAIDEEVTLPPTPRVQRRDFQLQRSLSVKVRFDMPDAQREALMSDRHAVLANAEELPERIAILDGGNLPFQTLGSWQRNHDGRVGEGYAGQILLQRAPPLYLHVFLGPMRLQTLHLAEMRDEVTFVIDAASLRQAVGGLRLRLVDASTGLPVVAAFVNVAMGASSPNEHGVLERSEVAPGRHDLRIWTENRYAAVSRVIHIRGGERLDLGDVQLEPSRTLHGVVVDQSDKGAVAYVHAMSLRDPQAPVPGPLLDAQSRADGRFDLAGVGDARHLVRAVTADGQRMGVAMAEKGSVGDVRIVLLPTFPVQLMSRLGAYQEGHATVRTVEGHALLCERLMGSRPARLRLPEGSFLLEWSGGGRDHLRSFTVTQQGATLELP